MMEISKEKKEKKKRIVSIWVCILIFIGAFFAGIQQTSNVTYRIYDFNRKDKNGNTRELHTESNM